MSRWRDFIHRRGGMRVWTYCALSLTAFFTFLSIANEISEAMSGEVERIYLFDRSILNWVSQFRTPALTQMMTDITALASFTVTVVFAFLVFIFLHLARDRFATMHFLLILLGSQFIPRVLKLHFARPRPDVVGRLAMVTDASFPSGHAFNAAALYLTIAFFVARTKKSRRTEALFIGLALILILLIGASRIYLGVHYPSDVFAGYCLGGGWALLVAACFYPRYRARQSRTAH